MVGDGQDEEAAAKQVMQTFEVLNSGDTNHVSILSSGL